MVKLHVQADGGAAGAGADVHGVAELTDHPEAVAVARVGRWAYLPSLGIGHVAAVVDLAQ